MKRQKKKRTSRFKNALTAPFRNLKDFFSTNPKDKTLGESIGAAIETPKELLPHIYALRKHLLRAFIALILGVVISLAFSRSILDWLTTPIGGIEILEAVDVTEPMSVVMRVSLLAGFAITLPYITFEIWLFIAPGLKAKPRFLSLIFIPLATVLFAGGMAFAFYVMLPPALNVLMNFMGLQTTPRPASYVRFVTGLMFWIGATFEFPLIIFVIAKLGWIKAKTLISQWRIAIVAIAVVAAVATPTPDPINMLIAMAPMIVLYLFSALLAYIAQL